MTGRYSGDGSIVLCMVNLSTGWRWVVISMLQPLYPKGKKFQFPFYGQGGP